MQGQVWAGHRSIGRLSTSKGGRKPKKPKEAAHLRADYLRQGAKNGGNIVDLALVVAHVPERVAHYLADRHRAPWHLYYDAEIGIRHLLDRLHHECGVLVEHALHSMRIFGEGNFVLHELLEIEGAHHLRLKELRSLAIQNGDFGDLVMRGSGGASRAPVAFVRKNVVEGAEEVFRGFFGEHGEVLLQGWHRFQGRG